MTKLPSPLLGLRSNGMVTAIGNSTAQTIASWLAETRRSRRIRLEGFADQFTITDCQTVTAALSGVERLASLLASAVIEAIESANHLVQDPDAECLEILLLPTWLDDGACEELSAMLTDWVTPYTGWTARPRSRLLIKAGTPGAWIGLEHAYRALTKKPSLRHVLIAAVDSACEPAQLLKAASNGLLLRQGNAQGYVAGEAAACILLERVHDINDLEVGQFALHRPALIQAPQLGPDVGDSDAAPLGQAIAAALTACGMKATHVSHLVSDMDGSAWRARLESTALNRVIFTETGALPHWQPASLFGQTGNSSGIIFWLLLAQLHQHHLERVNTALTWSIESTGEIAACVLERSPH